MKDSFCWKSILRLLNMYKGIAQARFGSGDSILFWSDMWNGWIIKLLYPQLQAFATNGNINVKSVIEKAALQDIFQLHISEEAYEQFCKVGVFMQPLQQNNENDVWSHIWGNGHYSSKKAYQQMIGTKRVHPVFGWIWRSSYQPKHKGFFWLLVQTKHKGAATMKKYASWITNMWSMLIT
jgi:hypothetical protein